MRGLQRHAVPAEQLDHDSADRLARLDRDNEDIAAAVGVLLHQHPQIRDEHETAYRGVRNGAFLLRIPAAALQEKQTALAAAVGRLREMTREVEGRVVRLPAIGHGDELLLAGDARDVRLVERTISNLRRLEPAFSLADEMVDLVGPHAVDLEFDQGHATGADREFAFAAEREDAPFALDRDLARQLGGGDDLRVILR